MLETTTLRMMESFQTPSRQARLDCDFRIIWKSAPAALSGRQPRSPRSTSRPHRIRAAQHRVAAFELVRLVVPSSRRAAEHLITFLRLRIAELQRTAPPKNVANGSD
ncbi:hypothetical protein GCM10009712_44110 [Pseudarthrobacter sulfonivorans]